MSRAYSSASSTSTNSDTLAIGLLTAGTLFVVGYTITRALLSQPAPQLESVVVEPVVAHEATMWNADMDVL